MVVRLLVGISVLSAAAFGGWPRTMNAGKGDWVDSPPPHPLAYYQVDPCLRPESDNLFTAFGCIPTTEAKELERRAKTTTQVTEIGRIGGFMVYDLWYSTGMYNTPGQRDLRSVLIKTGSDEYRELDVFELFGYPDAFPASQIVQMDGQELLIVEAHNGGNNNHIFKTPYIFREGGPEKADFSAVDKTVKALLPPYMSIRGSDEDFASMETIVELYRNDTHKPPVAVKERARITITYRFLDGHAVVTGNTYEPYFNN
jgi:hypothetical protein